MSAGIPKALMVAIDELDSSSRRAALTNWGLLDHADQVEVRRYLGSWRFRKIRSGMARMIATRLVLPRHRFVMPQQRSARS